MIAVFRRKESHNYIMKRTKLEVEKLTSLDFNVAEVADPVVERKNYGDSVDRGIFGVILTKFALFILKQII